MPPRPADCSGPYGGSGGGSRGAGGPRPQAQQTLPGPTAAWWTSRCGRPPRLARPETVFRTPENTMFTARFRDTKEVSGPYIVLTFLGARFASAGTDAGSSEQVHAEGGQNEEAEEEETETSGGAAPQR